MSCKLFSHRGFLSEKKFKENTLESFQNSLDYKFQAIELDLWYLEEKFILNHDKPSRDLSKYDKFADLLQKFGNKFEYWLDFKNLNPNNIQEAIKELKSIIDQSKISYSNFIFVPCLDNANLSDSFFAFDEIRNNFGKNCRLGSFLSKIKPQNFQSYYKNLKQNNIQNLSINFKNLNEDFIKFFSGINIFAWTVNNKKDLEYLEKLKVGNIATDKLTPKNEENRIG